MRRLAPEKWDDKPLLDHGFCVKSECAHCRVKMVEAEGSVYVSALGWMCEACFFGDTKPHCLPRPYAKPRQRKG